MHFSHMIIHIWTELISFSAIATLIAWRFTTLKLIVRFHVINSRVTSITTGAAKFFSIRIIRTWIRMRWPWWRCSCSWWWIQLTSTLLIIDSRRFILTIRSLNVNKKNWRLCNKILQLFLSKNHELWNKMNLKKMYL